MDPLSGDMGHPGQPCGNTITASEIRAALAPTKFNLGFAEVTEGERIGFFLVGLNAPWDGEIISADKKTVMISRSDLPLTLILDKIAGFVRYPREANGED